MYTVDGGDVAGIDANLEELAGIWDVCEAHAPELYKISLQFLRLVDAVLRSGCAHSFSE
jgi:hypothetical protein